MKQTFKLSWALIALLALTVVTSCKKDDDDDDGVQEVTAGFDYEVDADDPMTIHFNNLSENATSYSWDFGDGETSTEAEPSHTYTEASAYTVKLTATNAGGSDVVQQVITIVNAGELNMILAGETSKVWKLIRDVSGHRYPLEVAPDGGAIWWAFGLQEDLAVRPCMLNDEWKFNADGTMEFDAKGDYWAEGGVYDTTYDNTCHTTDEMMGVNGDDLSAWGNGTHDWAIEEGNLVLTGLGAYLGLSKAATGAEVKVPQESVTYKIVKLEEGTTADTLIVETSYLADGVTPAHWRFVLVHYPNPADEPDLPGPKPIVGYTHTVNGLTVTIDNTTTGADSYAWDFGDGSTSTEQSPSHTYAGPGAYTITLVATNQFGTAERSVLVWMPSDVTVTADLLIGSAWKIRMAPISVFVGPGLANYEWWQVPYADMQEGGAWACMMNDEFIFSADGVYEYKTMGDARNDGYKTGTAGCYSDAELATQDFPFLSAIHSYEVVTEGASTYILMTQGETPNVPFIGFYKGYYGGENNADATAPNGGSNTNRYEVIGYATSSGKEWLYLSVDLNGAEPEGNSWSVILERPVAR